MIEAAGAEMQAVESAYSQAKHGNWDIVLGDWRQDSPLAQRCSRYVKESSGWTFLHQAAYFGHETACRELIRRGAATGRLSRERLSAADVAAKQERPALAALLRKADLDEESLWAAPEDPTLLPSSKLWNEATERRATEVMRVAYGRGVVTIPATSRYFVDSFERTLVGWHGTFDPPSGMDGEPMGGL